MENENVTAEWSRAHPAFDPPPCAGMPGSKCHSYDVPVPARLHPISFVDVREVSSRVIEAYIEFPANLSDEAGVLPLAPVLAREEWEETRAEWKEQACVSLQQCDGKVRR